MINYIVYLFAGTIIASWLLCVSDIELKGIYKLILTVSLACFVGVVNSKYVLNGVSLLACAIGIITTICYYALCKAAKEN